MPKPALSDATSGQLRVLVALHETGSFASAARMLGTSRAYVWQEMHRLEEGLNKEDSAEPRVQLSVRGSGRLTPEGEALALAARRVVAATDQLRSVTDSVRNGVRVVRVACLPAQAPLVVKAAERLDRAGGRTRAELTDANDLFRRGSGVDLVRMLEERVVDVVVGPRTGGTDPSIATTTLYRWPLVAVAVGDLAKRLPTFTHPQSGTKTVRLRDIAAMAADGMRVLASPAGHVTRSLIDGTNLGVNVTFESESVDAVYMLASLGWGIGLMAGDAIPLRVAGDDPNRWPRVRHGNKVLSGVVAATTHPSRSATAAPAEFVAALAAVVKSDPALRWEKSP